MALCCTPGHARGAVGPRGDARVAAVQREPPPPLRRRHRGPARQGTCASHPLPWRLRDGRALDTPDNTAARGSAKAETSVRVARIWQ